MQTHAAVLATCWCTLAAIGQTPLTTVRVASGLTQPLFAAHAPGDASSMYVVERTGRIRVVNLATGQVAATPFLNISAQVATGWLEYGLLSIAFHPDYQDNGYFYVNCTPTPASGSIADTMIVRYRAVGSPRTADPSSATTILRFGYGNRREHRAGWMGFGPDRLLYVSTGDGGESDPDNAAQNLAMLRGKILRLDVNGPDGVPGTTDDDGFPADANKHYHIPGFNPFVGRENTAWEIWSYGLRNPWRCSFDRETGDLWIGDVGQTAREEIDMEPAGSLGGRNYGWRCTEGTVCSGLSGCTCNGPALTPPVFDYARTIGVSVTGGYVYRGCAIPDLRGTYLYADYQLSKVFSFRYVGGAVTQARERTAELAPGSGLSLSSLSSMGEDADGELYFCDYNGGELFKLAPRATPAPSIVITGQPAGATVCAPEPIVLSVVATSVAGPITYQWQFNGTPLADDGRVSGSSTPTLRIEPSLGFADSGTYDCVLRDPCKTVTTDPATVTAGPICFADYTCDGFIDFFDYLAFVTDFEAGVLRADLNGDGFLDFFDYDEFLMRFQIGC